MATDLDLRRPELLNVERLGTVRWFKADKGYGRITADDGEILFVHYSDVEMDGYKSLTEGQQVRFTWCGGVASHGRHHANDVSVIV